MATAPRSFTVTKRRRYAVMQQQQAFVREAMTRRVTPEVAEFLDAASERSRRASSAAFLNRFRAHATV